MNRLTIASLNIRHGQGMPKTIRSAYTSFRHPKESMEANAKHIARRIMALDPQPDVVCLQETNAMAIRWPDVAEIIRKRLGYAYIATAPVKRILPHNNAIISRVPFSSITSRQFRKRTLLKSANIASLMSSLNRGFMSVRIENFGLLINTHLDPFDSRVRKSEIKQLLSSLDPKEPALVIGDLNSASPNESCLQIITARGFYTTPTPNRNNFERHATWPYTKQSRREPFVRLDYIFATEHFTISEVQTFDTRFSDHAGLLSTITRETP